MKTTIQFLLTLLFFISLIFILNALSTALNTYWRPVW